MITRWPYCLVEALVEAMLARWQYCLSTAMITRWQQYQRLQQPMPARHTGQDNRHTATAPVFDLLAA